METVASGALALASKFVSIPKAIIVTDYILHLNPQASFVPSSISRCETRSFTRAHAMPLLCTSFDKILKRPELWHQIVHIIIINVCVSFDDVQVGHLRG